MRAPSSICRANVIKLYTTSGCHLCEEAMTLLRRARNAGYAIEVCEVEIAGSECLMETYGLRIPVVSRDDEMELGWPFSYEDLVDFIAHQK